MRTALMAASIITAMLAADTLASDKTGAKLEREKCYGVAKAQKNDCSAKDGSHACAGRAKKDWDNNTWVYVPKGLCDKLAGGVTGS